MADVLETEESDTGSDWIGVRTVAWRNQSDRSRCSSDYPRGTITSRCGETDRPTNRIQSGVSSAETYIRLATTVPGNRTAVLDDLSGFEFQDLMEDVFRKLGDENVRQARRTADEAGRLMEEVVDGTRRAVVECNHTGVVGRPVVQKLHSADATFDFDGPRRGMVLQRLTASLDP